MADLNIRNVNVTLVTALKVGAAASGKTLREYCIGRLGESHDDSRIDDSDAGRAVERSGNRATLPMVSKPKSTAKLLRPVQSVRGELAGRRRLNARPTGKPTCPVDASHRFLPNGDKFWCSDCGIEYPHG